MHSLEERLIQSSWLCWLFKSRRKFVMDRFDEYLKTKSEKSLQGFEDYLWRRSFFFFLMPGQKKAVKQYLDSQKTRSSGTASTPASRSKRPSATRGGARQEVGGGSNSSRKSLGSTTKKTQIPDAAIGGGSNPSRKSLGRGSSAPIPQASLNLINRYIINLKNIVEIIEEKLTPMFQTYPKQIEHLIHTLCSNLDNDDITDLRKEDDMNDLIEEFGLRTLWKEFLSLIDQMNKEGPQQSFPDALITELNGLLDRLVEIFKKLKKLKQQKAVRDSQSRRTASVKQLIRRIQSQRSGG